MSYYRHSLVGQRVVGINDNGKYIHGVLGSGYHGSIENGQHITRFGIKIITENGTPMDVMVKDTTIVSEEKFKMDLL